MDGLIEKKRSTKIHDRVHVGGVHHHCCGVAIHVLHCKVLDVLTVYWNNQMANNDQSEEQEFIYFKKKIHYKAQEEVLSA